MMNKEYIWTYIRTMTLALTAAAAVMIVGCEDPGSYGEVRPVIPDRVVVSAVTVEPPADDPLADIWNTVPRYGITVGDPDSAYTHDFGKFRVIMQAVQSPTRLYLRAEWLDPTMDTVPEYLYLTSITTYDTTSLDPFVVDTIVDTNWAKRSAFSADSTGIDLDNDSIFDYYLVENTAYNQDRFAIMWDLGDNGDEAVDCASMCHAPGDTSELGHRMYTTGGGHVDVWQWQVATSGPLMIARDEYWSSRGRELDQFTAPLAFKNVDTVATRPLFVHRDTTEYRGGYLFRSETREYTAVEDTTIDWPLDFTVPGFVLDEVAGGSIADVAAYSLYFKSTGLRYVVLMSRNLQANIVDDIDFTGIAPGDSVMASIAVMNNASRLHSGSAPFFIVFPE